MKDLRPKNTVLLCALLLSTPWFQAQQGPQDNEKSCLHFAQAFYDWYVAEVFKEFRVSHGKAPWHGALKYKGNPFSPELARALAESDAEAKADGDPVLFFDPILNSQDPAERYVVRTATRQNGHYLAEVYGAWSRPAHEEAKRAQVIAEVIFKDSRWQFANFHYPNSTNPDNESLLSILRYRYRPIDEKSHARRTRHQSPKLRQLDCRNAGSHRRAFRVSERQPIWVQSVVQFATKREREWKRQKRWVL